MPRGRHGIGRRDGPVAGDAAGDGTSVFRGGSSFPSVARRASAGPQRKEIAESVSERILCRFPNGPGRTWHPVRMRSVARLVSNEMDFHGLLSRNLYRNLDLHLVRVVRRSRDLRRSRLAGLPESAVSVGETGSPSPERLVESTAGAAAACATESAAARSASARAFASASAACCSACLAFSFSCSSAVLSASAKSRNA